MRTRAVVLFDPYGKGDGPLSIAIDALEILGGADVLASVARSLESEVLPPDGGAQEDGFND